MKTNLKISILIPFLCTIAFVNAQDRERWYADDIYYDTHEKEVEFFEFNFNFYEDEATETIGKAQGNELSYSARINRFHRNNYSPSLSFNYGFHHNPYHHFSSINYGFDPFFYDHDWHSYHYGWNTPYYYSHNYYNSWHSPWYHYNWWDRPYKNVYYNTVVETPFTKVHYGPRKGLTSNTPSRVNISNTNRQNRSTGSNRSNFNTTEKRLNSNNSYQRNKPNREQITRSDIYKDLKNTLERSVKEGRSQTKSNNTNRSYRSGRNSNSGNTNRSSNQSRSR